MFDILLKIYVLGLSYFLGVNLKDIKKISNKEVRKNPESLKISESIDIVSKKLEDSKEIIENALFEMEKQKELFEQLKQDAAISQQISSMNQEQVDAMNKLIESTLSKQEKKSFPKNLLLNLFFCVLGAVLGFVLGKLF